MTEPPKEAHGEPAWLDAGYAGMEDVVRAKHMTPIICEKGTRGHPLTDEQKERNRQKSKVRSRVEHVSGFMEQTMGGLVFRGVGVVRAKANIALTYFVHNMCRLVQIIEISIKFNCSIIKRISNNYYSMLRYCILFIVK